MMTPGLEAGAFGDAVGLLHQQLRRAGYEIASGETDRRFFGPSTRSAIMRHQQLEAIPVTGRADPATLAALAVPRRGNPADATGTEATQVTPPPTDLHPRRPAGVVSPATRATGDVDAEPTRNGYAVRGQVLWADGSPVVGVVVRSVDQDLRTEQPLGPYAPSFAEETRTDACGSYLIAYSRDQIAATETGTADLIVRVLGADGTIVAASPTMFNAPSEATVNLTISGAVAGQPSEYERLIARIAPLLHNADPPDVLALQLTDQAFLVGETGWNSSFIGVLLSAVSLSRDAAATHGKAEASAAQLASSSVAVAAFYGLLREGLPSTWAALLRSGSTAISSALVAAADAGIIPPYFADVADSIATELTSLAAQQLLIPASAVGPSTLSSVLGAARLSTAQQKTLLVAAASASGTPQQFWSELSTHPGFDTPGSVTRLQLSLQLGLLTGNHVPLIQQILADRAVSSPKNLLTLDAAAWTSLLATTVEGQPIGVPSGVPGETPAERTANYVHGIMTTLQVAFPNETIARLVATNTALIPDPGTRDGVGQFFANSPDFDIRTTRITTYVAHNGATAFAGVPAANQTAVVDHLKRFHRAFQISVSTDTMATLLSVGLHAAHLIANIPPRSFLDRYAAALGGEDVAQAVYERATFINARSVGMIAQLNDTVNGVWPVALTGGAYGNGSVTAQQQLIEAYPDYAELFGALDPCNCQDCTSVLSPTAYFVDMLQFLARSTPNAAMNTPLDVLIGKPAGNVDHPGLLGRRPDLAHLKLTCENTNTELPYIDLVNEILESYIVYNGPSEQAAHDTGKTTSAELDANPQYTLDDHSGPYTTLATAVYPVTLPYNQPIAAARIYLQSLGSSRYQVLNTFQRNPSAAAAVDAEYLRLDPYLYELLTGVNLHGQPVASLPVAYLYGHAPWELLWRVWAAGVPTFLTATRIQFTDLTALLRTAYVNPHYPVGPDLTFFTAIPFNYATLVTLAQAGFTTNDPTMISDLAHAGITLTELAQWWGRHPHIGQLLVIYSPQGSCDITDATLSPLGYQSVPTDAEFERLQGFIRLWRTVGWSVADLDRAFTVLGATAITPAFLHDLARIAQLQATLSLPALQMLFALWGNLDPNGEDSLYQQLYLNPAALPTDAAFEPAADGAVLHDPAELISGHIPALVAALQISAGDLALIRADAGLPATAPLTLANVSTLHRYAVLASALGISVSDFITIKALAGPSLDPFTTPDATTQFVSLAHNVTQSGFTATQLAYLYQQVSAPPTGLAPQQTTLAVLAQALRDGLTQIANQCRIAPDPKGTLTTSAITQLVSKTVATQTVALVNGTATYTAPLAALPPALARLDGSGNVTGVDPAKTPPEVGAKLTYDPARGTLGYTGAMTTQENAHLQLVSGDAGYQSALSSLFAQPATFLADNLGPLLDDPNAAAALLHTTASRDGQLNPVLLDTGGHPVSNATLAQTTAIAEKFAYLLGKFLPYLHKVLSHSLAKQTISDTFALDPILTSLLLEQILTSPTTAHHPLIGDLLALGATGATATYYTTVDLTGASTATATVAEVDFDATTSSATLPPGTRSATFCSWLEAPASAPFTFRVQTNGTPQLFVGDSATAVKLIADPATGVPTASVALTAGGLIYLRLEITALPSGPGTAVLSWQNPTTPSAPVAGPAQLPDALYHSFTLAYLRIQKAALLANQFTLTAPEVQHLTLVGANHLVAGFDLNALPLTAGTTTAAQATALFSVWPRLFAYTALRNSLPRGSVSLVDVFTAGSFGAAAMLIPQVTGWAPAVVTELLAEFFPMSTASTANPFVDEISLTTLQACVNLVHQVGASPAQLFSWTAYTATSPEATFDGLRGIANDIKKATASHYDPQTWLTVAGPLSNTLRASQRDALVAYLLGTKGWTDPNKLFELLLIDPEMGACMQTSRIRQALNSVQLFVQRCLLNLEAGADPQVIVEPGQIDAKTWRTWMGSYSLWAANREVFLYPENWLLPALRDDQTPLFATFASALQQGTISNDTVANSFLDYLHGLEQIDRLDIRSVFWQAPDPTQPDSAAILHVVGRTFHPPQQYYYRQQIAAQCWTPWQQVQADIQGDHLMAVIWNGRLRLIWPVFTQHIATPSTPASLMTDKGAPQPGSAPQTYWQITLAWTEYYQGAWQPKQVTDDFLMSINGLQTRGPNSPTIKLPQKNHSFKASADPDTGDLTVDMYVEYFHFSFLLGQFRFTFGGDAIDLAYTGWQGSWPNDVDRYPVEPGQGLTNAYPYTPTGTVRDGNGFREDGGYGGNETNHPLYGSLWLPDTGYWVPAGSAPTGSAQDRDMLSAYEVPYLCATPTAFDLRYSWQNPQFDRQTPLFYQDSEHTFCVTPIIVSGPISGQLADSSSIDVAGMLADVVEAGSTVADPTPIPTPSSVTGRGPAEVNSAISLTQRLTGAAPAGPFSRGFADCTPFVPEAAGDVSVSRAQASPDYQWSSALNGGVGTLFVRFETHRHPYVRDLIQELLRAQGQDKSAGIGGLLNVANQNLSNGFDFRRVYQASIFTDSRAATEIIDFSPTGAYSDYNWELFFHAPLLVALTLSQNQHFQDADTWFRYIFNPTTIDTTTASPQRYWQVQPFRAGVPQTLLQLMQNIHAGDPGAVAQVNDWKHHPFEPFRIARLRIGAFQKYVFMAYLDNLIAWGDQLFGQVDSIESINQATQLYIFASELLGELPERVPAPQSPTELSYTQIRCKLDVFSNFVEMVENEFPYAGGVTSNPQSQSAGLLGMSNLLFFCIPQNQQLLQYWSTVADRLYKIRHCLNIHGVPQQLALFEPSANPLLLIEAAAEGIDPGSVLADLSAPLPNYRFSYLIGKAAELTSTCQTFGRQLLDALEKNDAEGLALLRATQETAILTLIDDQKQQQVNEAQANVGALSASRAVAASRYLYYQTLLGVDNPAVPAVGVTIPLALIPCQPTKSSGGVQLLAEEQTELSLSDCAATNHRDAGPYQILASRLLELPTDSVGISAAPFGVGFTFSSSYGGTNQAASHEATVHGKETIANYLTYQAWSAGKMSGYLRRQQEWTLQNNIAAGEIMQIDQQTTAARIRVTIAQDDVAVNEKQTANARKVQDYLTNKFTNHQLYGWMITQASSLHSQLYQLAYSTAKLAEVAYQRELGVPDSRYITFGYWDSLRKGLLAGDRLHLAVKQLDRAYLDQNQRQFEITRHVSLLLHDPAALIALKTTGECVADLPEQLFDMDYPGQYLRMLRDVSLTIPCVAGPYTSINCTLTLVSSKIRFDPSTNTAGSGGARYGEKQGHDARFIYHFGSTAAIATSHAQDDNGVFSVTFRDDRYLPFETAGAVSRWMITMPPACNAFDFDTITDVVLKLSYTSRYGGDLLRSQAFTAATLPPLPQQTPASLVGPAPRQTNRDRLFSVKHEFPSEWYGLLHPTSTTAPYGHLPLWLTADRFPFQYRGRQLKTANIEVFALLQPGATLTSLAVYLTPAGPPPPTPRTPPTAPTPNPTDQLTLANQPLYGTTALYGVKSATAPTRVPQLWWLSLPASDLNNVIAQVEDFFVLFHYSVA